MSGHTTGRGHGPVHDREAQTGAAPGTSATGPKHSEREPFTRPEDLHDFERLVELRCPDDASRERVRTEVKRVASGAQAEYAAYLAVRHSGIGGFSPARAWGGSAVCAVAVFMLDLALSGSMVAAGYVATVAFASIRGVASFSSRGVASHGREAEAVSRRRDWLAALERGIDKELAKVRQDRGAGRNPTEWSAAAHRPEEKTEPPVKQQGQAVVPADTAVGYERAERAHGRARAPQTRRPTVDGTSQDSDGATRSSATLPLQEGWFIGRDHALSLISQWARHTERSGRRIPCVVVLHGPPGSGRTALAVRAAEMLRQRYQEMCLVSLRGRSSDTGRGGEVPLSTRDALLHLLNRLGAPQQDLLFRDLGSRDSHLRRLRKKYQDHVAELPIVLILDDAADARQVRPLLPENAASLVLITSTGPLEVGNGTPTHGIAVDPLSPPEAEALFTALSGPLSHGRSHKALLKAAEGLPLAVRMAGAALAEDKSEVKLPQGYPGEETVMRFAYQALSPEAQRLFRRLVLVGRASLGAAAASALLDTDEYDATERLADLSRAHLIEQVHSGRYRPHDMLRHFARQRLEEEESWQERAAAKERLISDYAKLAQSVIHRVEGVSSRFGRTDVRGFDSLDAALRWLDEESSFITATLRGTDDVDPLAVQRLVEALCDYCLLRGDLYRLGEINELVQSLGREPLIRSVKLRTGIAARQLGQLDRARTTLSSLVSLYREGHNEAGAAHALCSLGITLHHRGSLTEAEARLREAAELQRAADQSGDRAWTLHALGAVLRDRGELAEAWELLHTALALHEAAKSLHGQAWTCLQLGQVHLRIGQVEAAEERLRLSQELHRRTRDGRGEGWALTQLGRARLLRGQVERAVHGLNTARTWHRRHEDARGEAWTLYYLGQALEDAGRLDRAEDALSRARHMFSTMGDRYGYACARHHFGRVSRDRLARRSGSLKNSGFPRQLLHEARQDFRMVGLPHGEAWSCVELAVIDAGCGRVARAAELLGDATRLFEGLGDSQGASWAVFLHSTLLPLIRDDGLREAKSTLRELLEVPDDACHPTVREHAGTWLNGPWIGTKPDSPWPVWQRGLAPTRKARDVMGVDPRRPKTSGPPTPDPSAAQ